MSSRRSDRAGEAAPSARRTGIAGNPRSSPTPLHGVGLRVRAPSRAGSADAPAFQSAGNFRENGMQERASDLHPLSDLAYDWITLIQNKAQALMAYDQYIQDAERAGSPECAAFFRKVHDTDKAQLAEAKEHLVAVLQGKMGRG
jgi:hypothetical protein